MAKNLNRYGNRTQQNAFGSQGSGPQPQFSFDPATNHIIGLGYDAAGNLTNDGLHSYGYDADGNVVSVDGGQTFYAYDALNRRTRIQAQRGVYEFAFAASGRRVSTWVAGPGTLAQALI